MGLYGIVIFDKFSLLLRSVFMENIWMILIMVLASIVVNPFISADEPQAKVEVTDSEDQEETEESDDNTIVIEDDTESK